MRRWNENTNEVESALQAYNITKHMVIAQLQSLSWSLNSYTSNRYRSNNIDEPAAIDILLTNVHVCSQYV